MPKPNRSNSTPPNHTVGESTLFGLIRHGETLWNRQKKIQGQSDIPLAPEGVRQTEAWAVSLKEIRWDRILTSDLTRARETVAQINKAFGLPEIIDPRLREQSWGTWTGSTIKQLRIDHPGELTAQEEAGWDFRPPQGESRRQVLKRCKAALMAAADQWPGSNILVVAHNGVLKCLLYHLSGRRFLPSEPPLINPYHLHWIEALENGLVLRKINALNLSENNSWAETP